MRYITFFVPRWFLDKLHAGTPSDQADHWFFGRSYGPYVLDSEQHPVLSTSRISTKRRTIPLPLLYIVLFPFSGFGG
jgi:hypothetical protein